MLVARLMFCSLFLFSTVTLAAQSEYMHQPYISTRVMGFGGAFTALADDYNALYYNPAGLARLEATELNMGIQAGATPTILSFYNDVKAAGNDPNALTNVLNNNMGSHYSSRVGLGATLVRPSWGIGVNPVDVTVEADITAALGAAVGVVAYQDSTIQFGKAWNLNSQKSFNIGIAPKVVYRAFIDQDLFALDLINNGGSLFSISSASEGLTFDTDIGMLYTFDVPKEGWLKFLQYAKPTLGFAVRNAIDEGFTNNFHLLSKQTGNIPAAGYLGRRFDVGSRFDLPEFWVFKPRIMIDGRDMGSRYASFTKCFHAGTELAWKAFGWLKGSYALGYSEGYITGGVTALLGIFNLDLTTYAEEVGTAGASKQSRRYMAKASMDF